MIMKFTPTALLLTTTALLTPALAEDGIFSITGTGRTGPPSVVSLTVRNGVVSDPPTCDGSFESSPLPTSGNIACKEGYALSFTWNSINEGIAATYTNPTNTFTYNVPNLGCNENNECQFGFEDLFPGKKARGFKA